MTEQNLFFFLTHLHQSALVLRLHKLRLEQSVSASLAQWVQTSPSSPLDKCWNSSILTSYFPTVLLASYLSGGLK